ncbi:MAG TPA: hypothetical protein VGH04_03600, partial [Gemmatimonadaceae bacterium]
QIVLLFHGPTHDGPDEAVCADYRRKLPWATPEVLSQRQARDAIELVQLRAEWAADASVTMFRCEVGKGNVIGFRPLDPSAELHGTALGAPVATSRRHS